MNITIFIYEDIRYSFTNADLVQYTGKIGQCGSSSLLGKHADTMVMDFLATITTQRTYDRLDLIDVSIKMVVWGYSIHIRFCNGM